MKNVKKPTNYIKKYQNSTDLKVLMNAIANTVVELYDYTLEFESKLSYLTKDSTEMTIEERRKADEKSEEIRTLKSDMLKLQQELQNLKNNIKK